MKKLALTSLLAVCAVSSANAAINDNPLYRPDAGKFVSMTSVASHTENATEFAATEEFAYGVTDRLAIGISTSASENDWFEAASWDSFGVGADYRFFDGEVVKADAFASYDISGIWGDHADFLEEETTNYTWTVGARAGYTSGNLTLAGHVAFDYENIESFNWDDDGFHTLRAGVTGFLELNNNWGLLAAVEYNADLDNWEDNNGFWTGKFGVNYNITNDMFVAGYVAKEMNHTAGDGKWEVADGFGFGGKFGIQF